MTSRRLLWLGALLSGLTGWAGPSPAAAAAPIQAGVLKFHVQLIWGTDSEKPPPKPNDPPLKDLDPKLKKKFSGVFRWKNYFEVNQFDVAVPPIKPVKSVISNKCQIEITNGGNGKVEVKLFGEGKRVLTQRQHVKVGEPVVLAGHLIKNDSSWFVVLTPLDTSGALPTQAARK